MEQGVEDRTENLTVEQLMQLISRIDSAMEAAEEPADGLEDDLLTKCSDLENRLLQEQTKNRQLELAYNSVISGAYELHSDLKKTQPDAKYWRKRWNQAEEEKELLVREMEKVKEQCRRALEEGGKGRTALAVLEGDRDTLKRMSLAQLLEEEKRLLRALSILHETKASLQTNDQSMCLICEERKLAVLFRPCNHICVCEICAREVETCPICRAKIVGREKVFIH